MKISVIIPAYNCEGYIAQTLDCIYSQTMPRRDMEVIIYLDAPTDNTAAVVDAWMAAHRGLKVNVIRATRNRGVSYARNAAVRRARGEYVHFMDSDDLVNTDFYRAMYDAAKSTGADVAVASYRHQRRPNSSVAFDISVVVSNAQEKIDLTRVDQHGMMWRYLVRRDFWVREKFVFPEDMKICEDWVLANKMVYAANYIVTVPAAVYWYLWRQNSLISVGDKVREGGPDGIRANREMVEFLTENGLLRCQKHVMINDYRLFGGVRLFTVKSVDNKREWRLFGRILLWRAVKNYGMMRKPV